jgi:hypothetical protein
MRDQADLVVAPTVRPINGASIHLRDFDLAHGFAPVSWSSSSAQRGNSSESMCGGRRRAKTRMRTQRFIEGMMGTLGIQTRIYWSSFSGAFIDHLGPPRVEGNL